jgi:hypothetical protein
MTMDLQAISVRVAFGQDPTDPWARIALRVMEAAKVDDLMAANPDLADDISRLSDEDPSKKGKYLEWCVKQLKMKAKMEDLVPTIQAFHTNQQRLEKKDINQYKSLKELEDAVKALPESKTKEKARVKSEGSKKLWENDTHALFRIETRDACIQYGKGTRWCITMKAHNYWESYKSGNNVFYFLIDKRQSEPEKESETFSDVKSPRQYSKIAWAVQRSLDDNSVQNVTIFDANDKQIKKQTVPGIPEFGMLNNMVLEDAPSAPDGPVVSMRKGKIDPDELYDYLSVLDKQTLMANINYVIPDEKLDPALIAVVRKKQKDLSSSEVSTVLRKVKGGSPETDEAMLGLARQGVDLDMNVVRKGNTFDEALKLRLEREPDFLNERDNAKFIAKVTDTAFRKDLAEKHKAVMAETGILADKETLEELLNDEDPKVRRAAIKGLSKQPEMLASALRMVDDPDATVREALASISGWAWEKAGVPAEALHEALIKMLHDEDASVVEAAVGSDLSKVDHEILKKLAKHPHEKVRSKFHENPRVDDSLKPTNDESELVRNTMVKRRKISPESLDEMAKSADVNDRRLAISYVKERGYSSDYNDRYSAAGKKRIRDFAEKLSKDEDPQVRVTANSVLRMYGGKHSTEGFENSRDLDDVIAWIGNDAERAKSVLKEKPPGLNEEWGIAERARTTAKNVLKANDLMDYLSGKTEKLPEISNDHGSGLYQVVKLLPNEFLPKLLEKLPFEGVLMNGVFEDLAKRMDKKYALDILNKMPNPNHAQTAVTDIFKKLSQADIQKFIESDSSVVRQAVARRVDKSRLPEMIDDADNEVRRIVAEKIDPAQLPRMMKDSDPKVRRRVAERIDLEHLEQMRKDKSIRVRDVVKTRLGLASETSLMLLRVSYIVAGRGIASPAGLEPA